MVPHSKCSPADPGLGQACGAVDSHRDEVGLIEFLMENENARGAFNVPRRIP